MRGFITRRKLSELRANPPDPLPSHFATDVLVAARKLRGALRLHWRVLLAASLVALVLATVVGLQTGDSTATKTAPPLRIFQAADQTAPFVFE